MGKTYKRDKASREWKGAVRNMDLRAAERGTRRQTLQEMLAEAAANTAAIKTDDEPRAA